MRVENKIKISVCFAVKDKPFINQMGGKQSEKIWFICYQAGETKARERNMRQIKEASDDWCVCTEEEHLSASPHEGNISLASLIILFT